MAKDLVLEQENWIIDFAGKIDDHERWLDFMDFGRDTLLANQDLFIELIGNEALKLNEQEDVEARHVTDDMVRIFSELNIKLEPAGY